MKEIIVATKNKGKAVEFKDFFSGYDINAITLLELDKQIPDIEETGATFRENAALKAEQISSRLNQAVIADDSGLIVDALDGRPGIFSARYAGEPKDDQANIEKVLQEMQGVEEENRTARFICVLAIANPGMKTVFRTGYCEGLIALEAKGENGFGYDPIFIPQNHTKTMAQLSADMKNNLSHRRKAFIQLEKWLKNL